jgi:serine/threonine protein kinase
MSPEQIEGKAADRRSDIFALGAVLYEMAAGTRPFTGKSQISVASSVLEKDLGPISAVRPNTPPAFEHVLTTCLQKNPEERFQTAHDVKLELQWIASDRSATAQLVSSVTSANKREPVGWAAAVLAAIVLGAGRQIDPCRWAQSKHGLHPLQRTHQTLEGVHIKITLHFDPPSVRQYDGQTATRLLLQRWFPEGQFHRH